MPHPNFPLSILSLILSVISKVRVRVRVRVFFLHLHKPNKKYNHKRNKKSMRQIATHCLIVKLLRFAEYFNGIRGKM